MAGRQLRQQREAPSSTGAGGSGAAKGGTSWRWRMQSLSRFLVWVLFGGGTLTLVRELLPNDDQTQLAVIKLCELCCLVCVSEAVNAHHERYMSTALGSLIGKERWWSSYLDTGMQREKRRRQQKMHAIYQTFAFLFAAAALSLGFGSSVYKVLTSNSNIQHHDTRTHSATHSFEKPHLDRRHTHDMRKHTTRTSQNDIPSLGGAGRRLLYTNSQGAGPNNLYLYLPHTPQNIMLAMLVILLSVHVCQAWKQYFQIRAGEVGRKNTGVQRGRSSQVSSKLEQLPSTWHQLFARMLFLMALLNTAMAFSQISLLISRPERAVLLFIIHITALITVFGLCLCPPKLPEEGMYRSNATSFAHEHRLPKDDPEIARSFLSDRFSAPPLNGDDINGKMYTGYDNNLRGNNHISRVNDSYYDGIEYDTHDSGVRTSDDYW